MKTSLLLLIGLSLIAEQTSASSSQAWSAQDNAVIDSCVKASQLKGTQPAGTSTMFDDNVGYTALLLKGRYPQPFMKNKVGTELCLYQRKSKTAVVTEWDSVTTLPNQ